MTHKHGPAATALVALHAMVLLQVAAALREGRAVEPENYDCVTIFFSDIVGFTNISGILKPQEVHSLHVSLVSM